MNQISELASALIHSCQHVSPKRLIEPGPTLMQKSEILDAAGAAPDHGQTTPWHFYEISHNSRHALGEIFAQALLERDSAASKIQIEEAKLKALRGPLLFLVTARFNNELDSIPKQEKLISAGCAIQNVLLTANALGFGSGLSSGKALYSERMRNLFLLGPLEEPICFITIGTIATHKPNKQRPNSKFYSSIF